MLAPLIDGQRMAGIENSSTEIAAIDAKGQVVAQEGDIAIKLLQAVVQQLQSTLSKAAVESEKVSL